MTKRTELAKKYKVDKTYSYEQFPECLESGEMRGLHRAPQQHHRAYTEAAAKAGVHVLVEAHGRDGAGV